MTRKFDYGRMQAKASRLMNRFEQGTVLLVREVPGERPPDLPPYEPTPTVANTYSLDATVKSVSDKFIDGTLIFATDKEVTCSTAMQLIAVDGAPVAPSAASLEIQPGDTVSIDGRSVTIIKTMRIPDAGTPIVWKLIVRD